MTGALDEALLALWRRAWPPIRRRIGALFERVGEVVVPDPPMTIRTFDNEVLTGILVVDRSQVLVFLGARHPAASQATAGPRYTHEFDDEPLWERHVRPYGR